MQFVPNRGGAGEMQAEKQWQAAIRIKHHRRWHALIDQEANAWKREREDDWSSDEHQIGTDASLRVRKAGLALCEGW